jgi:hypothetical protein
MTEDHRPPGEHIVNVRISIHVIQPGSLGPLDEPGLPADGSKGTDWAVDPARDELLRFFKELDRSGDFHDGGAPYHVESDGSRKRQMRRGLAANCLRWGQKVL